MMNRREVFKALVTTGGLALISGGFFKKMTALAQSGAQDYKALVCLFLFGGNDSNNVIVPLDSRYGMYASARQGLTIPQSALLPLAGMPYGLHPAMPSSQQCFNQGSLAIVANMGPLIQPTTKAQYQAKTVPLPYNLASHADQRNCMASALQTSGFTSGWGGRMADVMATDFPASIPMVMSLYGATPFINGAYTNGYFPGGGFNCNEGGWCGAMDEAAHNIVELQSGATLIQAEQQMMARSETLNSNFRTAFAQAPTPSVTFPATSLGAQLQEVVKIMSVRNQLGASRQIFFVGMQSFDTHSNQIANHTPLLQQMDQAIQAFSQALESVNLFEQVTLFTLSEFARTLESNGGGGSDHGWGGHHIVMGGAVKGGQIYGSFPTLEFGGPDDVVGNGSWLPSTSVNQYAATLALWFGVPESALVQVLPNVQNFPSQTLGFL